MYRILEGHEHKTGTSTLASKSCVIVHNHPIHYQHLLFKALAKTGLDFEVLFTAACSRERLEAPLPKLQEYPYRIGCPGPYEGVKAKRAAMFVWRALSEIDPETVIISGYYDIAAWSAWTWARLHGAKRILWAESNEFDAPRYFLKELPKQFFVRHCHLAHVYGSSNASYLVKLGMPRNRIHIKRAVADTSRFVNLGLKNTKTGPKQLLYVGRFAKEKNLDFLLRALSELKQDRTDPALVLSLIGYGPLEGELKLLTTALGLDGVVHFPGKALQSELPEIYRQADIFVLPSTQEPWGLVANEAMLCGLPVLISTQCGCVRDLVNAQTGWSFSPWDKEDLTKLLEVVATTPRERLRQMGTAASDLAREYGPENCAATVFRMASTDVFGVPS